MAKSTLIFHKELGDEPQACRLRVKCEDCSTVYEWKPYWLKGLKGRVGSFYIPNLHLYAQYGCKHCEALWMLYEGIMTVEGYLEGFD